MTRMTEEELKRIASQKGYRIAGEREPAKPAATFAAPLALPAPAQSKIEQRFEHQLITRQVKPWLRNYCAIRGRDFELDFAWPAERVAVSIEGMAHRVKDRFKADTEKHALLLLAGWRVLRVCGDDVRKERAIAWAQRLLG